MVANPIGEVPPRPVFVTTLRSQVKIHVRGNGFFVAAAVTRIGVENVSGLILVEDADAGQLVDRESALVVVVVDLSVDDVFGPERNMLVEVEVVLERGDPSEVPAHALLERCNLR